MAMAHLLPYNHVDSTSLKVLLSPAFCLFWVQLRQTSRGFTHTRPFIFEFKVMGYT